MMMHLNFLQNAVVHMVYKKFLHCPEFRLFIYLLYASSTYLMTASTSVFSSIIIVIINSVFFIQLRSFCVVSVMRKDIQCSQKR